MDHILSRIFPNYWSKITCKIEHQSKILGVKVKLKVAHQKFYDLPESVYDEVNGVGLRGAYMTSRLAAKMMVARRSGLIVTVSSPGGLTYVLNVAYGLSKAGKDKMAADMACELRESNVASVSLWPCTAKTELFCDCGLVKMEHIQELFKASGIT